MEQNTILQVYHVQNGRRHRARKSIPRTGLNQANYVEFSVNMSDLSSFMFCFMLWRGIKSPVAPLKGSQL